MTKLDKVISDKATSKIAKIRTIKAMSILLPNSLCPVTGGQNGLLLGLVNTILLF